MHSTSNLEDGYIGSGKRLWLSINKHGKENHSIEILEYLPDRSSLKLREKELVNEDLLKNAMCMNLKVGGEGGFTNDEHRTNFIQACSNWKTIWNNEEQKIKHKERVSKRTKELWNNGVFTIPDWTGKKHSNETKSKMSSSAKNRLINSQTGTMWIHNLELKENKKIKKEDFINYSNWIKGRKMKF